MGIVTRYVFLFGSTMLLGVLITCISPFEFEGEKTLETMVVDGLLTNQIESNYILLYNTRGFNEAESQPLTNAIVFVRTTGGSSVNYTHIGNGRYVPPPDFVGIPGESYQLFIDLDGELYYTEPNTLIASNQINILGRAVNIPDAEIGRNVDGVQFFIESATPPNASHFRFEWEDSYRILVPFPTSHRLRDSVLFEVEESVAICYRTERSEQVLVKGIQQQTEKSLLEFPIRFRRTASQAYRSRYGLQVRQFTLTSEAFNYFDQLKKNNEGGGSLFDRQNGPLIGNIKNDNQKLALGYFQVSGISEIKGFYRLRDFGEHLIVPPFVPSCRDSRFVSTLDSVEFFQRAGWNVYDVSQFDPENIVYAMNFGACTDCTRLGRLEPTKWWED